MALFKNRQWAVTDYGVESVKPSPTYHFEAKRLLEIRGIGDDALYDWPLHMAEKTWVDIDAFNEAFAKAVKLHAGKYGGKVDPEMLKATLIEARQEALRR